MLLFTVKYYIKNNIALANLLIIAQLRQMKLDLVLMTLNGHLISSKAFRAVWRVPSLIYIYISRDLAGNKTNTLGTERLGICMWSAER